MVENSLKLYSCGSQEVYLDKRNKVKYVFLQIKFKLLKYAGQNVLNRLNQTVKKRFLFLI